MNVNMTLVDFYALSPLLIVLFGALLVLLVETFADSNCKKVPFFITLVTLGAALVANHYAPLTENPRLLDWVKFDKFAFQFNSLFLCVGIATTLLASSFFNKIESSVGEYYFLLLSAIFGLMLIGSSADFLILFIGIETLSLSLYVLCAYIKKWSLSSESAIKYFMMGSLAAAFLLYGVALIYGATGTTNFEGISEKFGSLEGSSNALFFAGVAFVTLALLFELAVVPVQFWAPDVYQGAPTPVVAFMAVGTKAGAIAALTRVFMLSLPHFDNLWNESVALLAYPTLIFANLAALRQKDLKRFFAYSGISHAGFLLFPLVAQTPDSLFAMLFYFAVYAFATLGAFSVVAFLDKGMLGVSIENLKGLFYRSPLLACLLSLFLLTLAGFPPTVGFLAKFFIFKVAYQAGYLPLVIVGLLTTVLSAYYYLKIVLVMMKKSDAHEEVPSFTWPAAIVGITSAVGILLLSLFPSGL